MSSAITARFSTEGIDQRDRVAVWREHYGRQVLRLDVEPQPGEPFHADVKSWILPGLSVVTGSTSALRVSRTKSLLTDGNDGFVLQFSAAGLVSQLGREIALGPSHFSVLSNANVGSLALPANSKILSVGLPRAVLTPLLRDTDRILARPFARNAEPVRLLLRHLSVLFGRDAPTTPELQKLYVTYALDLCAVVLGATGEPAEIARARGLQVARLHAVKDDILAHLHQSDLTLSKVARRHRMSVRHLQRLFDAQDETFTQFVIGQRLARAHRMLSSLRYAHIPISTIAFDVGFSDVSHFNHSFRRAFGMTPSDVRAGARTGVA